MNSIYEEHIPDEMYIDDEEVDEVNASQDEVGELEEVHRRESEIQEFYDSESVDEEGQDPVSVDDEELVDMGRPEAGPGTLVDADERHEDEQGVREQTSETLKRVSRRLPF
jgi:hypothetical protein